MKKNTTPPADESPKESTERDERNEHTPAPTEMDVLKKQNEEYLAGWQRARADYQNLQKDTARRITENSKYATEALLLELLPIVDHFKYAFKGIPAEERDSSWLKGIEYIQSNYMKILEEHGVEVIPTVGELFNPDLHESVEEVEADGVKTGIVVEEMATGFKLNGKVIQCAKVKIAK